MTRHFDVIIIGAGAAGMICAAEAARRGRRCLLIDHADTPGEKIRISGGGRCNFTNLHTKPENFISANPHFCKSALKGFTPHNFIARLDKRGIGWHEKTLGQLFCNDSARDIIDMLRDDIDDTGATLRPSTSVSGVSFAGGVYQVATSTGDYTSAALVIATGGLSIPKIGATGFGYDIARQFGHSIVPTRAALVPLLFSPDILATTKALSGVSVEDAVVSHGKTQFREGLLFTHRGLSGPSILQISSYWEDGDAISVNLLPDTALFDALKDKRQTQARQQAHNVLAEYLPRRLAEAIVAAAGFSDTRMADLSDKKLQDIAARVQTWRVMPTGTEGYRTAEVTRGGVDTRDISSKTMESRKQAGLYFIGEVVDVTGWLGGYNFQWAWSSGFCAGQYA